MMSAEHETWQLPYFRICVWEDGGRENQEAYNCRIGHELKFDTRRLETYCLATWEPIVYDALLLAAVIDFCDRVGTRKAHYWGRHFKVEIPVHDPDRWSPGLMDLLVDALSFVTGDRWHVVVKARKCKVNVARQRFLESPHPQSAVLPFSEGLDSCIVSRLLESVEGTNLIRVRVGPGASRSFEAGQPFACIPYRIRPVAYRFNETSARARGFRFAMLGGVAAYLARSSTVVIPESGQGALGPVLAPVGQAYEDYRNHPRFANKMEGFLSTLFNHTIRFSFPRIWHTKAETLREFVQLGDSSWLSTRSCWQPSTKVSVQGSRRQCGICAACMLRRMSVYAAGLSEPPDTYVWERLDTNKFADGAAPGFLRITGAMRQHAIGGTRHLDDLASLSNSKESLAVVQRTERQIAPLLGMSENNASSKMRRLIKQHASEWKEFVASLGSESFVANWIAPEL